jgi:GDP-4-dehydro-6-deoxy-D-mannose reductase
MVKTFFVTGADGFTGRHLIRHLKQAGHEAVGGVRNRARKLAFERQFGKALVCDISDAISVARAVASVKPDTVIHLAGTSQPAEAAEEPLLAYQSIVSAWANVLDAVRRAVPRAKVVLASACEVYGRSCNGQTPLTEETPTQPVDAFGSLKAAAEAIARTFFLNCHLDITIVRPFHYIGPGLPDGSYFGAVARRLAEWDSALGHGELSLPDLECRRDLLHVLDVVEAYARVAADGKPNQTYNICSGRTYTVREVVEMLARSAGREVRIVEQPAESSAIPTLWGGNDRLRNDTGWQPTRTVEQAAAELIGGMQGARQLQAAGA